MQTTKANNYADRGSSTPAPVVPVSPYQQAYKDNNFLLTSIQLNPLFVSATRAEAERYNRFLPALTRGQVVPNLYPKLQAGAYGANTNTFPRIISIQPYIRPTDVVKWTNPNVTAAWTEEIKAKYPALAKIPAHDSAKWSTIVSKGKVIYRDSSGKPDTWLYKGNYFSIAWAVAFDRLFHAGKIFADPSAYYYQQAYKAWLSLDFFESMRNLVEAVVIAIGAAYAAAALTGEGAGGATAGNAVSDTTVVTNAVPESATLEPIATSGATIGDTIAPVAAAGDVAGGAGILGTVASTVGGDLVKAAAGIGAAEILAGSKKPTQTDAPSLDAGSSTTQPSGGIGKTVIYIAVAALAAGLLA